LKEERKVEIFERKELLMLLFCDQRFCEVLRFFRSDRFDPLVNIDDFSGNLNRRICPNGIVKVRSFIVDDNPKESISSWIFTNHNIF